MNRYFEQGAGGHSRGAAGVAVQIASALAVLALSYAFTLAFNGLGGSLLTSACSFVRSGPDMHGKLSPITHVAEVSCEGPCQECGGGTGRRSSGLDVMPNDKAILLTIYRPVVSAASSDSLLAASLSTPDRHWCMAEAFKAELDKKKHNTAM